MKKKKMKNVKMSDDAGIGEHYITQGRGLGVGVGVGVGVVLRAYTHARKHARKHALWGI